ncbi:hypothetical protein GH714_020688 [Hevea brasiliensis]|uniref:ubiquitinyl hydrolase 1 n=1 Tax=Hevea brasiliensis TaxID=3981 RepID=A0A6A6KT49_HEVBR|nr:hypothetical protein GH714_020688 [Hevea brasiliensis]
MGEILFLCGSDKRLVIANLNGICCDIEGLAKDETIAKALEDLSIESASDLHKILRIETYTSQASAMQRLQVMIPVFQSRMGALLFLISALLSRGLAGDEHTFCQLTEPGYNVYELSYNTNLTRLHGMFMLPIHAKMHLLFRIVFKLTGMIQAFLWSLHLLGMPLRLSLMCFGRMDLGGGMCLKGISTSVEVGFLTLLESLNFCKVGQHLKCPKWPIWVVGSESHYTVLFALDTTVQDENELEERESQIRKAFDAQDQSGGGGFISVEGFQQVLRETSIRLPPEKLDHLCGTGFIVWSEFWQVILDLDKSLGGLKDSSGLMGKKVFDLYHFNGIAKSDLNGSHMALGGETPVQRPRLTKLRVSVPPRWTPEEFMADVVVSSGSGGNESSGKDTEVTKPEPAQHAPLVDCVRTRWARAVCNWVGDPPSIV